MNIFNRLKKNIGGKDKKVGKLAQGVKKLVKDKSVDSKARLAEASAKREDLTLAQLEAKESKVAKPGKKKVAAKAGKQTGLSYKWILRPVITEKATYLGGENKYIFEVALKANKIEIRKAINKLYGVDVIKVNIVRSRGKKVTYGRITGTTKRTKKAIITLKPGQSISVYEGV